MRALSVNSEINHLFNTMAEVIFETERAHGGGFWPFSPLRLHPIVADPFFKEFHRVLIALENSGYTPQDMAKLLINPNRVADYNFLWGFAKELSPEDGEYVATRVVEILSILRRGNPFSTDKRNTIWSDEEVRQTLLTMPFFNLEGNTESKGLISKIETLLTLYAELLYFIFPGFSRMYHGPYYINGKTIFIKEFIDLKPAWLWNFTDDFPFSRYLGIGIYRDIRIKVNFVGLIEADKPFPHNLSSVSVAIDGEPILALEKLKELVDTVQTKVSSYTEIVKSYSYRDLLAQGIRMFFYSLGPLYQALHEDIQVPVEVLSISEEERKSERPRPLGDLSREEALERILQNIDIRFRKLKRIRIIALDFIGVIAEPNPSFDIIKFMNTVAENSMLPVSEREVVFHAWDKHLNAHKGDPLECIKRIGSFFNNLKYLDVGSVRRIGKEVEGIVATQFYIPKRVMKELLAYLCQRGYIIHIITHVPSTIIDRFLTFNGFGGLINKIYSAESGKISGILYKNLYKIIIDDAIKLAFKPFEILIIDDQKKNLEKAKENGLLTILLADHDTGIVTENTDFVASDPEDLMKKL